MPKSRLKREFHELRATAWEAEIGQALLPIADLFDSWRRGETSALALVEAIHRFHDGENREIWKKHQSRDTGMLLAEALEDGGWTSSAGADHRLDLLGPGTLR